MVWFIPVSLPLNRKIEMLFAFRYKPVGTQIILSDSCHRTAQQSLASLTTSPTLSPSKPVPKWSNKFLKALADLLRLSPIECFCIVCEWMLAEEYRSDLAKHIFNWTNLKRGLHFFPILNQGYSIWVNRKGQSNWRFLPVSFESCMAEITVRTKRNNYIAEAVVSSRWFSKIGKLSSLLELKLRSGWKYCWSSNALLR